MPSTPPASSAPSAPSAAELPPPLPTVQKANARGCDLELTLTPDKPRFLLGEPVFLTFRVTTSCDKPLSVLDGGDYRNKFGRAETYKMSAVAASGVRVAPIDAGPQFGGMMGPRPLAKGKPFEKRLLVAHWIEFPGAGRYTLTVEKDLLVGEASTPSADDKSAVPVKVSVVIDVQPASSEGMGAVIAAIGKRALGPPGDDAEEAIRQLTALHDPRVVDYWLRLSEVHDYSRIFTAVMGLGQWNDDRALAALVRVSGIRPEELPASGYTTEALRVQSAGALRLSAAQALAASPHPKAWDALWVLRGDADENVRLTVLHALAKKDFPDEIARLKVFEKDASAMVRGEAQRYLRERKP